jgi:hypothetical protein
MLMPRQLCIEKPGVGEADRMMRSNIDIKAFKITI